MAQDAGLQIRWQDRRDPRARFTLPERRTGFDRRHTGGFLLHLSNHALPLISLLTVLNLLSFTDWILTLDALKAGAAEANGVLRALLNASPLAAGVFKTTSMLGVSLGIWYGRRYRLIDAVAVGAVGVYCLVVAYHLAARAALTM